MRHKIYTKVVLTVVDEHDTSQYEGLSPLQNGDTGIVLEESDCPFVFWYRTKEARCVLHCQIVPIERRL